MRSIHINHRIPDDPNMVEASLLMKQATRDQLEDRNFAKTVVSLWGPFIKDLSVKFRDDTEIMLKAILSGASLKSASHRLRSDKAFVLSIVRSSGDNLEWASTDIQGDKEVAVAAVTSSCQALRWASSNLKDDAEVVLAAIDQYSSGIRFASNRLQNDKSFISSALKLSSYVFDGIPDELQCDKKFILSELHNLNCNYYRLPTIFSNDREVVTAALRVRGENYYNISEELKADRNLFLLALANCDDVTSTLILHAPKSLQCNRDVVLSAVGANWLNLQWVLDEFKDDADVVLLAIGSDLEQQEIEFQAMEFASNRLKDDKNFVRKAISINWICFDEVSERLKNDSSFVAELCKINKSIFQLSKLELGKTTKGMDSGVQSEQHAHPKTGQASSTSNSFFGRWKELTPEQKAASAAKQIPIMYQTAIGGVQLLFDDKKIEYGELILPISRITGLRWGKIGSSGSEDVSKYIIFFSNLGIGNIVIEWASKEDGDSDKFKMITYWLTKLVAPKLISEMQIKFYRGETISIGKLKCSKEGVTFVITGFFGAKDHVCPWCKIGTEINEGVIHIFDASNQKARCALNLSEVENAFVLHTFPKR